MDFHAIYESGADAYDDLVSAEDVDGNLLPALERIATLAGRRIVEVGAGTGRVTRLLLDAGADVHATEPAADMARVAARRLTGARHTITRADAGALPFSDGAAHIAIAGWVLAHQREWQPDRWRNVVRSFVDEMQRVVRVDGTVILIETLGTGHERPQPSAELAEYYTWLESDLGFERAWIRTDYAFDSIEEAAAVTGSFFGAEFAALVEARRWRRIPECTGIWWRR